MTTKEAFYKLLSSSDVNVQVGDHWVSLWVKDGRVGCLSPIRRTKPHPRLKSIINLDPVEARVEVFGMADEVVVIEEFTELQKMQRVLIAEEANRESAEHHKRLTEAVQRILQ